MCLVRSLFLLNALSHAVHLYLLRWTFKFCWVVPGSSFPCADDDGDTANDGADGVTNGVADSADGANVDGVDDADGSLLPCAVTDAGDSAADSAIADAVADGFLLLFDDDFDAAVERALKLIDIISLGIPFY